MQRPAIKKEIHSGDLYSSVRLEHKVRGEELTNQAIKALNKPTPSAKEVYQKLKKARKE